jgi:phage terminase large subunit-like protein
LAAFRRRFNYPDLKRALQEEACQHHADIVLVEDKGWGTHLIQDLRFEGVCGIQPYEAYFAPSFLLVGVSSNLVFAGTRLPVDR